MVVGEIIHSRPANLDQALFAIGCVSIILWAGTLWAGQANQEELESYSRQAQQAMAQQDWQTATRALEKLAELTPNVPEVQGDLGLAYYSQGRILEAAQAFERTLKLNPKMTQARLTLGLCYAELGRNQEAVSILEPACRHPPDSQVGRLIGLSLQRAYAAEGQHLRAMTVAEELLKRYPNDPEILFQASRLHADRAYQTMRQLMQADPNSAWVHYATAEVHESLQHYDLATAEYQRALEMQPRLPGVHFRLGRVLLESSKDSKTVDEALSEFQKDLAIDPENSDAEYEIGEINRERGQLEQALEHFSRAVRFHAEFPEALVGLARTLLSLGKYEEARTHLEAAIRLDPSNDVAHFLLASAYKALGEAGNYQKEMAQFEKLRASQARVRSPTPAGLRTSEVTEQVLGSEAFPGR